MDRNDPDTVHLTPRGSFAAMGGHRSSDRASWYLVPNAGADRWILAGPARLETVAPIVSLHASLDAGLSALADAAGLGEPFVVRIRGGSFKRPGAVRAEEIVRTLGHEIVRSVLGFVLVRTEGGETERQVRGWLEGEIAGTALKVESCERVDLEVGETDWCCGLRLGMEGVVSPDVAIASIRSICRDRDLEALEEIDVDRWGGTETNMATVLPMTRAA